MHYVHVLVYTILNEGLTYWHRERERETERERERSFTIGIILSVISILSGDSSNNDDNTVLGRPDEPASTSACATTMQKDYGSPTWSFRVLTWLVKKIDLCPTGATFSLTSRLFHMVHAERKEENKQKVSNSNAAINL